MQLLDDGSVLVAEQGRARILSLWPIGNPALSSAVADFGSTQN